MIEIYVDGDGCPVKEETYRVAARYRIPVSVVANSWIQVPADVGARMIVVEQGPDVADDWIAERAGSGDIVVTADIPLAARCLKSGALVLGTHGKEFSEDSIGDRLAMRDLNAQLRETGELSGGLPPMSNKDRSRFLSKLDELVQRSLRAG